jgi:Ca-activated chloride channel homolog
VRAVSFASPWLLLLLLLVPAAVAVAVAVDRRRARYAVAFTNLDVLASVAVDRRRRAWRRWVPLALFVLALASASVAVARPRAKVSEPLDRATIVLLVDVSGSMRSSDVKPTRLGAAQAAMERFVAKVPKGVKLGLVSFSTEPNILVMPTTDRVQMQEGLELLTPESGTAIGDGIAAAVDVAKAGIGNAPRGPDGKAPAAIILLSDGAQTRGRLQPLQGAARASAAGIPIFTIALGTNHGTLNFGGGFFGGGGPNFGGGPGGFNLLVRPDPAIMAAIAKATGGMTFQAKTASKVDQVYKQLGKSVVHHDRTHEISSWFAAVAAGLLLAALAAGAAVNGRLP